MVAHMIVLFSNAFPFVWPHAIMFLLHVGHPSLGCIPLDMVPQWGHFGVSTFLGLHSFPSFIHVGLCCPGFMGKPLVNHPIVRGLVTVESTMIFTLPPQPWMTNGLQAVGYRSQARVPGFPCPILSANQVSDGWELYPLSVQLKPLEQLRSFLRFLFYAIFVLARLNSH